MIVIYMDIINLGVYIIIAIVFLGIVYNLIKEFFGKK